MRHEQKAEEFVNRGRIVKRVPVKGAEQEWPQNTVRYCSRRWTGPVHMITQGIDLNIRYIGLHEHVGCGIYPLHYHPHSELVITISGRGSFCFPGSNSIESCDPGHLVVLPPTRIHQSRWSCESSEPWRVFVVNYDLVIELGKIFEESGESVDLAFAPFYEWFYILEKSGLMLVDKDRDVVIGFLDEIIQALLERKYGICSEIVAGLIKTIAVFSRYLKRMGLADGSNIAQPYVSKDAALLRARSMLDRGGSGDAGCVTRIANAINMSESHFIREFKRVFGVTPKQFSIDSCMRRAAALLDHTDVTVKEAANQLGYDDPTSFSRAFLKYHGVSPRDHQRQGRNRKG